MFVLMMHVRGQVDTALLGIGEVYGWDTKISSLAYSIQYDIVSYSQTQGPSGTTSEEKISHSKGGMELW